MRTQFIREFDKTPIMDADKSPVLFVAPAGRDLLVVRVSEFKNARSLDLRRYWYNEQANQWQPTQKGAGVPASVVQDFFKAVEPTTVFTLLNASIGDAPKARKSLATRKKNKVASQYRR